MARINFDVPGADGQPSVTYGIDFDNMTPAEIASRLGLDAASGKRLSAAAKALAPDATAQARINKLVATGIVMATKAASSGGNPLTLLTGLV